MTCLPIWSRLPRFPARQITILCLATSAMVSWAQTDVPGRILQRDRLIVGVDYVSPTYIAGAKFRTPESLDSEVAAGLAKRLKVGLSMVRVKPENRLQLLTSGKVDALLLRVSEGEIASMASGQKVVMTGYQAQPKLIMRTDTTIKQWSHLKGRSVCVSAGSPYVGSMQARYGAQEIVVKAPADALLAVRTGVCDATVHDDVLLDEMLKLPEWKKFSASLPLAGPTTKLVWVLRPVDVEVRRAAFDLMQDWRSNGFWLNTRKKWVNTVAFEVYLDQNVPDCH